MEDSLEDFIRISKNKKIEEPPPIKKEILITAQVKKECNNRAMKIVELCLDGRLRTETLFNCLPYINPDFYQDIVEERAISKLCGYPVCGKRIPDMPQKQYHISTKQNKVYDLTERKNFCSNHCYKASIHIKQQIDSSPLWLRKYETRPEFNLLKKEDKGLPGKEVDQGIVKPEVEPSFTSINAFTTLSLDEMVELEVNPKKSTNKSKPHKPNLKMTMETISEKTDEFEETNESLEENIIKESTKTVDETEPNPIVEVDTCTKKKKKNKKTKIKIHENVENEILKSFKEWISLETLIFLYGEEKVKQTINDEKLSDYFDSLKIAELQIDQQKKYLEICKKLHLRELAEEKFDAAIIGKNNLKPIPDYQQLKEESKILDLKVKSFYSGVLNVEEDKNFPQKKNQNQKEITENQDDSVPVVLPLVDVASQTALRRKIFLKSLNKSLEEILEILSLSPSVILPEIQQLVKTFKLKPNNIVFKPLIWKYVVIILLQILTLKDSELKNVMENDANKKYIQLCLDELPSKTSLLNKILDLVKDIDSFTKYYITSDDN